MVRALLEGRKTVTRRVVKPQPPMALAYCFAGTNQGKWSYSPYDKGIFWLYRWHMKFWIPPCHAGDILYVRETWSTISEWVGFPDGVKPYDGYIYRADWPVKERPRWHPSIHMPKEAARIFLRVTNVWVERLQGITENQAIAEGCESKGGNMALDKFEILWDSTVKQTDLPLYGWSANPWVWVIDFERISKEEAVKHEPLPIARRGGDGT